jgi:HSP20 family protein
LTGTVRVDDEAEAKPNKRSVSVRDEDDALTSVWADEESEPEGELTVDVYQTPDAIVIKSMVAGVRPEDLDISITRDVVSIHGHREEERVAKDDDYFARELYWGSFSRTVQLPEEIDVDKADAIQKHGLLILKLPKLDKKKQSKLKVKVG